MSKQRQTFYGKYQQSARREESSVKYTDDACDIIIVASANGPFGVAFKDNVVNQQLKNQLKRCRSPTDGWTYHLKWLNDMWAHMQMVEDQGFCTLDEFLDSDSFKEIWNDDTMDPRT